MTAPSSGKPASPSPVPSVWEDLLEVLYAPRAVFARREKYVAFGLAMVIVTVAATAVFFAIKGALEPALDGLMKQQLAEALRRNPQVSAEQMQGALPVMRGTTIGFILASPIVMPLLTGLMLWLVGKFFESKAGLGAAVMVATYAWVPRLLGLVVGGILALVLPEERLTSLFSITVSPAQLVDQQTTSLGVLSVLARADLFIIWQVIIQTIGIAVLGKMSTGKAAVIAITVWLLAMLPILPSLM
jgi:hypothetical protein